MEGKGEGETQRDPVLARASCERGHCRVQKVVVNQHKYDGETHTHSIYE